MKTNLTKKVQRLLDNRFPNCSVLRVVRDWYNDSVYIYLIVVTQSGLIYAAWNRADSFNDYDFNLFQSVEDAHRYINRELCVGYGD